MEAPFLVERLARFSVWVRNWIHFDSIVVFWQSGANGLLIHTSLGNGFTTGARPSTHPGMVRTNSSGLLNSLESFMPEIP